MSEAVVVMYSLHTSPSPTFYITSRHRRLHFNGRFQSEPGLANAEISKMTYFVLVFFDVIPATEPAMLKKIIRSK